VMTRATGYLYFWLIDQPPNTRALIVITLWTSIGQILVKMTPFYSNSHTSHPKQNMVSNTTSVANRTDKTITIHLLFQQPTANFTYDTEYLTGMHHRVK